MQDKIIIKGAREHNLKNVDLVLPKNKLVVFTGLSGSGKSTLAFDTIFAEGQRRPDTQSRRLDAQRSRQARHPGRRRIPEEILQANAPHHAQIRNRKVPGGKKAEIFER